MPTLIRKGAAAAQIVRHARITTARCESKGATYAVLAHSFLAAPLGLARSVAARVAQLQGQLEALQADQAMADLDANDAASLAKDTMYNAIGRPGSDPIFLEVFPDGASTYRSPSAKDKPLAIELLCTLLETNPHPLFPPEQVAEVTTRLRAAAARVEAANQLVAPKLSLLRLLTTQYASNARRTQTQLARMKKRLKSDGMSEHDVHLLIPIATQAKTAKKVTDLTPEDILDATFGDLHDPPPAAETTTSTGATSEASAGTTDGTAAGATSDAAANASTDAPPSSDPAA